MRNRFERIRGILHHLGQLLLILGLMMLIPPLWILLDPASAAHRMPHYGAFGGSALLTLVVGGLLRRVFPSRPIDLTGALLMCALGWIGICLFGALPFLLLLDIPVLDAFFESFSGFTTAGMTVIPDLDHTAVSLLLWRALSQWLGGIGILSFFLLLSIQGGSSHHLYGAESTKITTLRPVPGIANTVRIIWTLYLSLTLLAVLTYKLLGLAWLDAVCHGMTSISTGGFSTHDASIGHYRQAGHGRFLWVEYVSIVFMVLGSINFFVYYRFLRRDPKGLWDSTEIRTWWFLLLAFTGLVFLDHARAIRLWDAIRVEGLDWTRIEQAFRTSLFQVTAMLTSSGYATEDIGSRQAFGPVSRQLFLMMMLIGGCVGSTTGGFKTLRIVILNRVILNEIFRAQVSARTTSGVVLDGKRLDGREIDRIAGLFFAWMLLIAFGGIVTAMFSDLDGLASLSGMFSAVCNIGPSFIPAQEVINLHPVVKVTYILGMLAGRLEVIPLFLLLSPRAWR